MSLSLPDKRQKSGVGLGIAGTLAARLVQHDHNFGPPCVTSPTPGGFLTPTPPGSSNTSAETTTVPMPVFRVLVLRSSGAPSLQLHTGEHKSLPRSQKLNPSGAKTEYRTLTINTMSECRRPPEVTRELVRERIIMPRVEIGC